MVDRVVVPVDQLRRFADASRAMADDRRPRGGWLDDALDRVHATTDPGFRPPVFGDGADVRRWCDAVVELDGWVATVADLFADVDDPSWLHEWLLLPGAGAPDLPTAGGLLALLGLGPLPDDQTIEEFDHVRRELAERPTWSGPGWTRSTPTNGPPWSGRGGRR